MTFLHKEPGLDLGIWFDDSLHQVTPRYMEALKSVGIERVHIMVDRSTKGWNPRFDREHCELIESLFRDFRKIVVIWPEPTKGYVNDLRRDLPWIVKLTNAVGVEFDCEHNWKRRLVRGYDNLEEAGLELVEVTDQLFSKAFGGSRCADLYVTTFPAHLEASASATVTPFVDYLNLQVYSVRQRDQQPSSWRGALDPGVFQTNSLTNAQVALDTQGRGVELVSGIALWDQKWEGRPESDAIQAAWDASLEHTNRLTFWSSKFLVGGRKNSYSLSALRQILASD